VDAGIAATGAGRLPQAYLRLIRCAARRRAGRAARQARATRYRRRGVGPGSAPGRIKRAAARARDADTATIRAYGSQGGWRVNIDEAYAELGVVPGASEAQVKAAWRRLVSLWHPDRNASAEAAAQIQRINGAYERIRLASAAPAASAGPAGSERSAAPARESKAAPGGRTVRRRVRLTIEEAVQGCTRMLRGRLVDRCSACDGSGELRRPVRCATCEGSGRRRSGWWRVWPAPDATCPDCRGSGTLPRVCPVCEGSGRQARLYRHVVRLPAGVRHGDVLRADGGGAHRGGFDGSLELHIELAAHPFFALGDDASVHCEFPVDGYAWLAGAWIEVPTPGGLQQMQLRRGHTAYRLRGRGLPRAHDSSERGDYVVKVVPTFPDTLSAEQQALLERLTATGETPPALAAWRARLQRWERARR